MTQSKKIERIDQIISGLLDEISKQYLTDASVLPLILSNDESQMKKLQILDFLQQSVLTSLQFGQYRRATWYLQAFSQVCDNTLGDRNQDGMIRMLRERIQI